MTIHNFVSSCDY